MVVTIIPALNPNHTNFCPMSILLNFLVGIPGNGAARTQSDTLVGAVKRQCAELQPFLQVPSNTVLCRLQPGRLQSFSGPRHSRTNREGAMAEPVPGTPPSLRPPEDHLDSWKEIATYLKRDVTTVQRWEKREGMPVHRHQHDRIGSVYASRAELDAWVPSRNLRAGQQNGNEVRSPEPAALVVLIGGAPETTSSTPEFPALKPATGAPKSWRWQVLVGAAVVLVAVGGWFLWTRGRNSPPPGKHEL